MTHDEAIARCRQLNREQSGTSRTWKPRESGAGIWDVAAVVDLDAPRDPVHASTAEKEPADRLDDLRSSFERNVGGPYVGG